MKEFIEYLIKHLVDKPEEVQINEIAGERTVLLELRVDDGDMAKVIGRRGETANSLRILLKAAAAKQGKRSFLEILDRDIMKQKNSQLENTAQRVTARKPLSEPEPNDERRWQDDGGNNCQDLLQRCL